MKKSVSMFVQTMMRATRAMKITNIKDQLEYAWDNLDIQSKAIHHKEAD